MKERKTKKYIMNTYNRIVRVSFCELQNLLSAMDPIYYTDRPEGWAADIYYVGHGNVICTGYAPFGNVKADYDLCKKYDAEALKIKNETSDRNKVAEKLDDLIDEFMEEAK